VRQNRPLVTPAPDSAIQHFHDKLLHLKDMLKTDLGRRLGERRHAFMVQFLQQVDEELGVV
jgi:uncharacterized protein